MLGSYTISAQSLKFKIQDQPDTTVHLVKYFGKKLFYADTAQIVNGLVQFDGSKQKAGILALYLPGEKLLEFVYNEEPEVYIEASSKNLMGSAEVKPTNSYPISIENKIFLEYVQFISTKKGEAGAKLKERDGLDSEDPQYIRFTTQLDAINQEISEYKEKIGKEQWDPAYLKGQEEKIAAFTAKREGLDPKNKKYKALTAQIQTTEKETEDYKESIIEKYLDEGYIKGKELKLNEIVKLRDGYKKETDEYKRLTTEIDALNAEVEIYQRNIAENPNNLLVSKIVLMSMDVSIPEAPVNEKGVIIDSNFRFNYYRTHYFDNIDLHDDRLMRTPVFHNKFTNYFSKNLMLQHWDTIIHYAFQFCDNLDPKSDMFQYTVSWITSEYEKSKIMGMNKVFIYMGKRYYCTPNEKGESPAHWMPKKNLETLCEKVDTHYDLVMGATPPNLILRDTTDVKWRDFYSLDNEYTILYFWDPECGHCKKITPKLQTLYEKKWRDRNIEIFAVGKAVGDDFGKWKKFIAKNKLEFINVAVTANLYDSALINASYFVPRYTTIESLNYQKTYDIYATPKVWVLDKDKKIIAYSLTVSQLENLIDRLQKKSDSPVLFPEENEDPEEDKMH